MSILPRNFYNQKSDTLVKLIQELSTKSKWISRLRLIVFISGILCIWALWGQAILMIALLLFIVLLFTFLIRYNDATDQKLKLFQHLYSLTGEELKSLDHHFLHKPDGEKLIQAVGMESNDLDLLGKGSLFQFVNRSISDMGQKEMARSLTSPGENIKAKQEAIQELSQKMEWILTFRAIQSLSPLSQRSKDFLSGWIKVNTTGSVPAFYPLLSKVLPLFSILLVGLYAFNFIHDQVFTFAVLLILAIQGFFASRAAGIFKQINHINEELKSLSPCLESIESETFNSPLLNEIKSNLLIPEIASESIKKLNAIFNRYDYRMNIVVFIPLNFFTWWDIRLMIELHDWKKSLRGNIDLWYDSLAKFEMFSSFATLAFNKPDWCYPEINTAWFTLVTKDLGHPLIASTKVVTNNFTLSHPNHLALITGSNMAGKSTFLRSVGANMALANAGSPVCAAIFIWSPCQCLTSMRISDNLQEETSTFYAELKKVKKMIDAIKANEKVILLIDEMLRGTNAEDRRLGVNAFVSQMIKANAVGIIASHDSTIYHFSNEYPDQVKPYYFDSHVENDELKFDYKIKPGTDTSANASFLMKKIGIEIE